jgi:hypothetical protein
MQRELLNSRGMRGELETKWRDQISQWRAKMPEGEKDFPWPGASNLEFPLTAIHSDPVYSDFMATFHASGDEFWHSAPRRPDRIAHANSLREGLARINRDFLRMRQVNKVAFLYDVILGTAIYKNHWKHMDVKRRGYNLATGKQENVLDFVSQPAIEHVPLQHFYIPPDAWDINPDAPVGAAKWVAQKFYMTTGGLKEKTRETLGVEPAWDTKETNRLLSFIESSQQEDDVDREIRSQDDYEPFRFRRVELYEVWARYDVDGDGIEEDVVVTIHMPTTAIVKAIFNPFAHGKRPFHKINYLPGLGFYGLGIAEISEWSQATLTKLLNALIDNLMVANTRMYSAPRGSEIMPGEPIYPGKVWLTEPGESVSELRLGDVYQSLPQAMSAMLQWAEQRTGVSELRQGNITGLPSRTPASTVLSILREGNKRFDMIVSNMREPFTDMGYELLQNLAQYCPEDEAKWTRYFVNALGEEDAQRFMEVLQNPESLAEEFGLQVSATSGQANKELEKQSFVGVLQLVSQLYPQLVDTAMLIQQSPPGSPVFQTAVSAYTGGVELLRRLLERFDIQNPEQYLPNAQAIFGALEQMQAGGIAGTPATGGQPPVGAPAGQAGPLQQGDLGAVLGI